MYLQPIGIGSWDFYGKWTVYEQQKSIINGDIIGYMTSFFGILMEICCEIYKVEIDGCYWHVANKIFLDVRRW